VIKKRKPTEGKKVDPRGIIPLPGINSFGRKVKAGSLKGGRKGEKTRRKRGGFWGFPGLRSKGFDGNVEDAGGKNRNWN